ncbi:hypothetical protein T4D_3837 [Trichinella pseudospiralis]|uniref:Uncharacterized protein n=1 Tax=Trichinella pseudospiralis TaxID=6337 RepID=A0A0V1FXL2_TRIPS|nr:hypothetical protein T4D_3837 [Trichinella pseudospiralis]
MIHKRTIKTALRSQFNNMTAKSQKVLPYCITVDIVIMRILKIVADAIHRLKKLIDKYNY